MNDAPMRIEALQNTSAPLHEPSRNLWRQETMAQRLRAQSTAPVISFYSWIQKCELGEDELLAQTVADAIRAPASAAASASDPSPESL